jgi:hypothetical protein
MRWLDTDYQPDIVVLTTGLWSAAWLGSPNSYEASLRSFAAGFAAWKNSLVRIMRMLAAQSLQSSRYLLGALHAIVTAVSDVQISTSAHTSCGSRYAEA